jgi:hypothetical protein
MLGFKAIKCTGTGIGCVYGFGDILDLNTFITRRDVNSTASGLRVHPSARAGLAATGKTRRSYCSFPFELRDQLRAVSSKSIRRL